MPPIAWAGDYGKAVKLHLLVVIKRLSAFAPAYGLPPQAGRWLHVEAVTAKPCDYVYW